MFFYFKQLSLNINPINPIQDGPFWGCSWMGVGGWGVGDKKAPSR